MKRLKWHYLLFIPAIVVPFGVIYGLWIQDGGILATNIRGIWFYVAIALSVWAVSLSLQIISMTLNWES